MQIRTSDVKRWLNVGLASANLRLDTLTRDRTEAARVERLRTHGHFDRPMFPVLESFRRADPWPLLNEVRRHAARFRSFLRAEDNAAGFSYDNGFFSSPDAEILYAVLRKDAPRRVFEIGCGNSTRITRLAISDGGLDTRLTCIDPHPREDVAGLGDDVLRMPLEDPQALALLSGLQLGDLLFIDSSHLVKSGNDVVALFLEVLPALPSGVLVHIHDVFLPYDYPYEWVAEEQYDFAEQYLVQVMLQSSDRYEVLWPAFYLQKTLPDFASHFEHLNGRRAQSLWLRTR